MYLVILSLKTTSLTSSYFFLVHKARRKTNMLGIVVSWASLYKSRILLSFFNVKDFNLDSWSL